MVFEPLTGSQLVLGTIALSLATFMNVLDSSIANVSIPAIAGDMGVSPAQGTWVIASFGVANAISVPLTGWLTQRFGQVRLFTTLWDDRTALHHAQLSEAVNRGNDAAMQVLGQFAASGMQQDQALFNINRLVDQQAATMAVTDLFHLSSILFFALIVVIWLSRPSAGGAMGGGGAH